LIVASLSSYQIVGGRTSSIQADLEINHFSPLEEVHRIIIKRNPVGADAGDEVFTVTGLQDLKKILFDKGLSTAKIYLKDSMGRKLVDHV
jgi:hypothetical protein